MSKIILKTGLTPMAMPATINESVLSEPSCDTDHRSEQIPQNVSISSSTEHAFSASQTISTSSLKVDLRSWAINHNLKHSALSDLLKLLQKWYPSDNYPADARTLLKTPRSIQLTEVCGGSYYYFGLRNHIIRIISQGLVYYKGKVLQNHIGISNLITLKVGIDGVPVSKSSNIQLWPILASVDQARDANPFVVAIFCGNQKPQNVNEYLQPFVHELVNLEEQGLETNGLVYSIRVRCIVADAPARSFIKCTKNHNAYYGCERCNCKGEWHRRVIFRSTCEMYTEETFRSQKFEKHHEGDSPLLPLSMDMIFQIPLDYMHLCCLGIMKKLLLVWTSKTGYKLSATQQAIVSGRLVSFRKFTPNNFARKPRSLTEFKHFKATEFRQFMLYIGPVALRGILGSERYKHFLLYHTGMYILVSKAANDLDWVNYAGALLQEFVLGIETHYYKELLTYNMHSLKHIRDDVKVLGPVDDFSAFEFENYMTVLKRLMRSNRDHLKQVVKRILETDLVPSSRRLRTEKNIKVTSKVGDNCFLTVDSRLCLVQKYDEENQECSVLIFRTSKRAKYYPMHSSELGIYICKDLNHSAQLIKVSALSKKCYRVPFKEKWFCIPLCHVDV